MPSLVALVPTDLARTRLGLPSLATRMLAGRPVLAHTVARLLAVRRVERVVLLHPPGQEPLAVLPAELAKAVTAKLDPAGLTDDYHALRTAARAWSLAAWRGGLGGATCYDELLPAASLLHALQDAGGSAALLVGGDWPLVDPRVCDALAELHLDHPEGMPLVFNQAPPGLSGIVVAEKVLAQLAANPGAMIGQVLGYVPTRPQPDPIGKDVCVQVSAEVRGSVHRFICDTPRSAALLDALAARLGTETAGADAARVAAAASEVAGGIAGAFLPQQVTLELTPRREVTGPLVPQHHVSLNRTPLSPAAAAGILAELGTQPDVALTLGGLGDALLHPGWAEIAEAAHAAGVLGLCVETDLLADRATLARVLELPIDVLSVRINADRAETYARVMGADRFGRVIENLQWLFHRRQERHAAPREGKGRPRQRGLPWIVPRMVKAADTLDDLEGFFDKWMHFLGHAVIEPATGGCGLMPELAPVRMTPPRRRPCRQLGRRMTVHADARVARCDQDWLGRAPAGEPGAPLAESWRSLRVVEAEHQAGRWDSLELCAGCHEWHRP